MRQLDQWRQEGSKPITDPTQIIACLTQAVEDKDKQTILDLYDADQCDWENDANYDQYFDQYDSVVDDANDIVYYGFVQ